MTAPDTKAIRALKSKRSKCADVGNIDLSNVPESHETIWLQWGDNGGDDDTWCSDNINDDDVPYIRADLVFALCDEIERLTKERDEARAQVAFNPTTVLAGATETPRAERGRVMDGTAMGAVTAPPLHHRSRSHCDPSCASQTRCPRPARRHVQSSAAAAPSPARYR